MNRPIVFYLTEQTIGEQSGAIKLLYVEYLDYWQTYQCLSPFPVDIPLDIQYHLHIGAPILNNVFQVEKDDITEQDFIEAGFVKDLTFEQMFKDYQYAQQ